MAKRNFKKVSLEQRWFMGETTITVGGITFTHLDLLEAPSLGAVMSALEAKASEWIKNGGVIANVTEIVEVSNETANELRLKQVL